MLEIWERWAAKLYPSKPAKKKPAKSTRRRKPAKMAAPKRGKASPKRGQRRKAA